MDYLQDDVYTTLHFVQVSNGAQSNDSIEPFDDDDEEDPCSTGASLASSGGWSGYVCLN